MKTKWFILSFLFLVTAHCFAAGNSETVPLDRAIQMAARNVEDNVKTGQRIALLNFKSPSEQFSEYVLEELTSQLVNGKRVTVVDRRELELIRQEENFQLSGEVSDESAQAIGKKLGAQLIVSGSLNAIGNTYRVRIKVLNVETAAIEASPSVDISAAEERVTILLNGKGSVQANTNSRQTATAKTAEDAPKTGQVNTDSRQTATGASSKKLERVYVAGSYGERRQACYWVDGVRKDLPVPDRTEISATSIAVSNGKVYVAGYVYNGVTFTACYWVDGVRTDLPSPRGDDGIACNIAVSGGKVYVAGQVGRDPYNNDNSATACYWVDGVRKDLPVPDRSGRNVTSIAVSDGKVYVAGSYVVRKGGLAARYGDTDHSVDDLAVCYWVDGVRTDLSVPRSISIRAESVTAINIAVSGGKVYVAGSYTYWIRGGNNIYNASPISTYYYWVDGVRKDIDLPVPSGAESTVTGIAVSGGKVYVAGNVKNRDTSTACYWVDGVRTDMPVPNTRGEASGIAVSGGKVYVVGNVNRDTSTACYWVDGVKTDLLVPSGTTGQGMAIAIEE